MWRFAPLLCLGIWPALAIAGPVTLSVPPGTPRALERALDAAMPRERGDAQDAVAARQLGREAASAALSVLRAEGYYGADAEPSFEGAPPQVRLAVTPGPQFLLAPVSMTAPGLSDPLTNRLLAATGLKAGDPALSAAIVAGEAAALATLRQAGYADAKLLPRRVVVDHASQQVSVSLMFDPGAPVLLGPVALRGGGTRTKALYIDGLRDWQPGTAYTPKKLADLTSALQATGTFSTVAVSVAPADPAAPVAPRAVLVDLSDAPRWGVAAGATWSTADGIGVEAQGERRNLLRTADTLTLSARAATLEQSLEAKLELPHWQGRDRMASLRSAGGRRSTDAFDQYFLSLGADLSVPFDAHSRLLLGAQIDGTRSRTPGMPREWFVQLVGLTGLAIDRSDDFLNPQKGWRADVRAEPIALTGERTRGALRLTGTVSAYQPIADGRVVAAARLKAGSLQFLERDDVPRDLRFYAGGGGSVRGYAFQAIGPTGPAPRAGDPPVPLGGRGLLEASLELRGRVWGPWGAAAFIDAGSISRSGLPSLNDMRLGAGMGLRYDAGFAPFRIDVGFPLSRRQGDELLQVYISIGQAF